MKIYFIRHGLTELNKQKLVNAQIDEPLSSEGIEQAKAVSLIMPKTVTQIFASSMLRTRQTTDIINEKLQLSVAFQDELREINMGSLAGKSWESFNDEGEKMKIKHRAMQFDYTKIGGESAQHFKMRVTDFLETIQGKYKDHEVLVVAHGGVLRLLHLLESGNEEQDELENASLKSFDLDQILNPKD